VSNETRDPDTGRYTANESSGLTSALAELQGNDQARAALNDAGIFKPEDLMPGRMDMGKAAAILQRQGIDPEVSPIQAEKALRDADYLEQAGISQPQVQQPQQQEPEPDRLAQLQAQLEQRDAEIRRLNNHDPEIKYRRRLRAIEERLSGIGQTTQTQPPQYPPVAMPNMGIDPNMPVTQADVMSLMMAQSQAFGTHLQRVREEAIKEARALRNYDLTPDEEEDLLDAHPWLQALPVGQREQAMYAVARPNVGNGSAPPAPGKRLTPQPTSQEELMRQRVRQTAFIPAPNRSSVPEQEAHRGGDTARGLLLKKYQEAVNRPGGSEDALKILTQLGAGPVDDRR
jgi:hypothetical protein